MPELRPYQHTAKAAIYAALRDHDRVLLQLPTGGGKTVIIAAICADAVTHGRAVVIAVHRRELVEQTVEKLHAVGIRPALITADAPTRHSDVYVAMIQTLARRRPPRAHLCIIDEAHHATASTYECALEYPKVIGVTATPCRLDGKGLADVFQHLVLGPTVKDLIAQGHLCAADVYSTALPDTTELRTTAGDYNRNQLAAFMERSVLHGDLVSTYNSITPGAKCLVYAASVDLAQRYCDEYRRAGIPAACIDGSMPSSERARIIDAYRQGRVQVLTNYAIVTEGFDVPDTEVVQLVRPTKSLSLYLQMVGRALRPAPGKTRAIILDHGQCVKRHGFPDDDREWSLNPSRKRIKLPPLVEVDIDLPDRERRPPEHLHAVQLQRVTPPPPTLDEIDRLIQHQERNGFKKGWVLHQWRKRHPNATREQLKHFAKKMGYHHKWVDHQISISQTYTKNAPPSTSSMPV